MAVNGFSVMYSEFAVHSLEEITIAKPNDANRARTAIIRK